MEKKIPHWREHFQTCKHFFWRLQKCSNDENLARIWIYRLAKRKRCNYSTWNLQLQFLRCSQIAVYDMRECGEEGLRLCDCVHIYIYRAQIMAWESLKRHSSLMMWPNEDERWHYKLQHDTVTQDTMKLLQSTCSWINGDLNLDTDLFEIWTFWAHLKCGVKVYRGSRFIGGQDYICIYISGVPSI